MHLWSFVHSSSLQIPEKREASDRERPFWDTASRDWPSQPSERQKLTLSTSITSHTDISTLRRAVPQCHRRKKKHCTVYCTDTVHVEIMQIKLCSSKITTHVWICALQYWDMQLHTHTKYMHTQNSTTHVKRIKALHVQIPLNVSD